MLACCFSYPESGAPEFTDPVSRMIQRYGLLFCWACLPCSPCASVQRRPLPPLPSPDGSPGPIADMPHGGYFDSAETVLASGVQQSARYKKAQEAWEALTTDMIRRWASNGGKGRKITINASGMVCTTYEAYLRRFPGTMLSDMVCEPGGDLQIKSVLFIDRHPFATYEIVNCYRDGFLPVKPPHIPFEVIMSSTRARLCLLVLGCKPQAP